MVQAPPPWKGSSVLQLPLTAYHTTQYSNKWLFSSLSRWVLIFHQDYKFSWNEVHGFYLSPQPRVHAGHLFDISWQFDCSLWTDTILITWELLRFFDPAPDPLNQICSLTRCPGDANTLTRRCRCCWSADSLNKHSVGLEPLAQPMKAQNRTSSAHSVIFSVISHSRTIY